MYVLRKEKADYVSLVSASGCYIGGPIYVNPGILALVYGMTLRSFKCNNHNLEHDVSNVNVQLIQIILPSTNQQTWWSPWLPITRQGPNILPFFVFGTPSGLSVFSYIRPFKMWKDLFFCENKWSYMFVYNSIHCTLLNNYVLTKLVRIFSILGPLTS